MTQALSSVSLVLTRLADPPPEDEHFGMLSTAVRELDGSLKRLRVRPVRAHWAGAMRRTGMVS